MSIVGVLVAGLVGTAVVSTVAWRPARMRAGLDVVRNARTRVPTALLAATALVLAACGGTSSDRAPAASTDASPPMPAPAGAATPSPTGAPTPAPTGASPGAVSPGPRVPDLEVSTFGGETVSLGAFTGTPLVVNFWASWCPPCITEMPDLEAVHELADDRVRFLGVNTQDTPDRAAELVDETGVTYELVRDPDGAVFRAFGVFGMPSTFYVDADGSVVGRHTGLLTRDALRDDLRDHLGVDLDESG